MRWAKLTRSSFQTICGRNTTACQPAMEWQHVAEDFGYFLGQSTGLSWGARQGYSFYQMEHICTEGEVDGMSCFFKENRLALQIFSSQSSVKEQFSGSIWKILFLECLEDRWIHTKSLQKYRKRLYIMLCCGLFQNGLINHHWLGLHKISPKQTNNPVPTNQSTS